MRWFARISFYLKSLFLKKKLDAQLAEEVRTHVEMATEANVTKGMTPEEARYAALREFGNVAVIQEQTREVHGWVWLEQFWQDVRFAVRMLGKSPGVTVTAVLTLALGIGVNAALFAVYDIMALRPLPSRAPEELVEIRGRNEQVRGGADARVSYPDYLDYCAGTQAFSDIAAMVPTRVRLPELVAPAGGSPLESVPGIVSLQAVSGNYFPALGAEIVLGRDFLPEEAGPHTGRPVIVLSHLFWQTHLRGDPGVLGTTLATVDLQGGTGRTVYTVVGVAAPDFVGQSAIPPAGWIPLVAHPTVISNRARPLVSMIGRMRAGISTAQAKADLDEIARQLGRLYPEERRANSVQLLPGMRLTNFALDPMFALAMSPVLLGFALVLVIACLNVANLLLSRGVTRQHEIGVRLVLGAGRGRIVRQLFAENFLLCVLGAGAALLLAIWTLQALKPMLLSLLAGEIEARNYVSMIEIGLDRRMVGFGAVLAVVAGLTAGLAPALHSVRRDGVFALKQDGSAFGRKMTPSRLRGLLLVGQVAASLTMLAVSGLMTGTLLKARAAEAGFSTDGVYQVRPAAPGGTAGAFASDPLGAVETLRMLPGVAAACLVAETPLGKPGGNLRSVLVKIAGGNPMKAGYNRVSAGFFEAFGVPVQRGRAFSPHEVAAGAPVVVMSEATARWLWPGQEAVGKILSVDASMFGRRAGQPAPALNQSYRDFEVIGVTRDFRSNWTGTENAEQRVIMFPLPAEGAAGTLYVRLQADSTGMLRGVERTAATAGLPVQFQERLATIVDRSLWPFRAFALISGALSGLALLLATVGLWGVMSFGVSQRVREIGVRMALGATAERVTGLLVRQGMRLVTWGVAAGLVGGAAFTALLGKALPGAHFTGDLAFRCVVFCVVTVFVAGVALLACWLPARRAAKVDPMVALRAE